MTSGNVYLINAESGIPMFKQVVQTLGATIPTSVLAYQLTGAEYDTNLSMNLLDTYFQLSQVNVEIYSLQTGDSVIFEVPAFAVSQEIATGMSMYMANIDSALNLDPGSIKVLFYTPILGH
jgi:hypothetical protein